MNERLNASEAAYERAIQRARARAYAEVTQVGLDITHTHGVVFTPVTEEVYAN